VQRPTGLIKDKAHALKARFQKCLIKIECFARVNICVLSKPLQNNWWFLIKKILERHHSIKDVKFFRVLAIDL
jgi:hypothetical protein